MTLKEAYKNDIENANEIILEQQEEIKKLRDTLKFRTDISIYLRSKIDSALEYALTHRTTFNIDKIINILAGKDNE